MIDLFYFVIILLVFVAAYGVASQVILYPNSPLNIRLARDVLSSAWWSMYIELNLDEASGTYVDNSLATESVHSHNSSIDHSQQLHGT